MARIEYDRDKVVVAGPRKSTHLSILECHVVNARRDRFARVRKSWRWRVLTRGRPGPGLALFNNIWIRADGGQPRVRSLARRTRLSTRTGRASPSEEEVRS